MCHRSHDWVECSKGEKEDSVSGGASRFSGDLFPFDGEIYPCHKSRTEKQTESIQPVKRQGKKEKNKQQECGKYRVPAVFV